MHWWYIWPKRRMWIHLEAGWIRILLLSHNYNNSKVMWTQHHLLYVLMMMMCFSSRHPRFPHHHCHRDLSGVPLRRVRRLHFYDSQRLQRGSQPLPRPLSHSPSRLTPPPSPPISLRSLLSPDHCRRTRVGNTWRHTNTKGSCWSECESEAALHDEAPDWDSGRSVRSGTLETRSVASHHLCNWQEIRHYKLLHKPSFHIYLCTTVTNLYTSLKGNVYI